MTESDAQQGFDATLEDMARAPTRTPAEGSEEQVGLNDTLAPAAKLMDQALRSPQMQHARASARAKLFGGSAHPVRIDRFVVVERLGGGGMGVVYAAYDPQLDRKVALKLLRPDGPDGGGTELARRLVREAQAMAKVSHPNVITVHEVGTFEGDVFVAMEFVQGRTLGQWIEDGDRPWPDIRRLFLSIGRGLAAAHTAGLVHRDFKPDNVMIDEDDRPRVLDFGLARVEAEVERSRNVAEGDDLALTRTGTVMGTPAYMAPEQHVCARVDARADQFSFCVALFEAVFGRRPFPGKTYAALSQSVVEGNIELPDDRGDMPQRAYQAMLRGLSADADDRFDSMDALLVELAHDPSHARRRWLLGVGTLGLMVGTAIAAGELAANDPACDRAAATMSRAWSRATRKQGRDAFGATDKPYAAGAWVMAADRIDAYVQQWEDIHRSTCGLSDDLPETDRLGRIACLEWRAQELEALTDLLTAADGEVVERASEIVGGLTEPGTCASPTALRITARLPKDPALRADVLEQRADLAHAQGLREAGKYQEAAAVIESILGSPLVEVHPGLGAEASLRLGQLRRSTGDLDGAESSLADAVYDALAGERDDLAFAAALELLWVIGTDRMDFERARPWLRLCEGLRSRQDQSSRAVGRLDLALGSLLAAAGRHGEAREAFAAAVARRREAGSEPELVEALSALAQSAFGAGDHAEGLAHLDEAIALAERSGQAVDEVAPLLEQAAGLRWKLGRYEEAAAGYERTLESVRAGRGEGHPAVAPPLAGLAAVAWARGEHEQALALTEQVLGLALAGRIEDEALVNALEVRANIFAARDDFTRAARAIDRGLAIGRRHGQRHPMQAYMFLAQARVARRDGRLDDAERDLDQARSVLGAAFGPGDPRRQEIAVAVGLTLLEQGEHNRGRDVLLRAQRTLRACCRDHFALADIEAALARAEPVPSDP